MGKLAERRLEPVAGFGQFQPHPHLALLQALWQNSLFQGRFSAVAAFCELPITFFSSALPCRAPSVDMRFGMRWQSRRRAEISEIGRMKNEIQPGAGGPQSQPNPGLLGKSLTPAFFWRDFRLNNLTTYA